RAKIDRGHIADIAIGNRQRLGCGRGQVVGAEIAQREHVFVDAGTSYRFDIVRPIETTEVEIHRSSDIITDGRGSGGGGVKEERPRASGRSVQRGEAIVEKVQDGTFGHAEMYSRNLILNID